MVASGATRSAGRPTTSRGCWPSWRSAAPRSARLRAIAAVTGLLSQPRRRWPRRPGSRRRSAASSTRPRSPALVGRRSSADGAGGRDHALLARRRRALRSTATCRPSSTSTPTSCATGSGISISSTTSRRDSRRRTTSRAPSRRRSRRGRRRSASTSPARAERARASRSTSTGCARGSPSRSATRRSTRAARRASSRSRRHSTRRSGRSCSRRPRSGQEGLDFHLWCHAVVHWNLPANPVDLEQREGRVHRYKCHAVRRNIAATLGPDALRRRVADGADPWDWLFELAAAAEARGDDEMVPYWVFHQGPAKIERHVPVLPFSREAAIAAHGCARRWPPTASPSANRARRSCSSSSVRDRSETDLFDLAKRLRIDLTPPRAPT